MTNKPSQEKLEEIRKSFDFFDNDNNDVIDFEGFISWWQS